MKRMAFAVVVVLFVCGVTLGQQQGQGSLVQSGNSQTMYGAGGMQGQGALAGDFQSQSQGGCYWRQSQCGGSLIGQVQGQGGGMGYKSQEQCAVASIGQEQKLGRCRDSQVQEMNLKAQQDESQCGRGGVQFQGNGVGSLQGQSQGSWYNNQSQSQAGVIIQVEGQAGGCFGAQNQGQFASVSAGQSQTK